jgi:signal transduction histidine kinase
LFQVSCLSKQLRTGSDRLTCRAALEWPRRIRCHMILREAKLFEFMPVPLLVLDPALGILMANSAFREKLNCPRTDVEGLAIDQLKLIRWTTPELLSALRRVAEGGLTLLNFPCEAVLVDLGRPLSFLVHARRLAPPDGTSPVVLVALQDVTAQRLHEEESDYLVAQLKTLNDALEQRVAERTRELNHAIESLRAMSRRVVEAQENERQAVARELHDDVGQALTGLTMMLERALHERPTATVQEAQRIVSDLLQRVRRLSVNLRPHVLDDLGLLPALKWHAKNYAKQTGLRISLKVEGCDGLAIPADTALTVFRVTQEALTNVSRHAAAKRVRVQLRGGAEQLELLVADNGQGFDVNRAHAESSGLRNMRERVEFSQGEFSIKSESGRGTTLRARLPMGRNPI